MVYLSEGILPHLKVGEYGHRLHRDHSWLAMMLLRYVCKREYAQCYMLNSKVRLQVIITVYFSFLFYQPSFVHG